MVLHNVVLTEVISFLEFICLQVNAWLRTHSGGLTSEVVSREIPLNFMNKWQWIGIATNKKEIDYNGVVIPVLDL